jgi:hypothetical protein
MFPGHKMPVIEAVDHLKAHTELVNIPSEPLKERRGWKGVETLCGIRNPWKWGCELSPVLEFSHDLIE